MSSKRTVPNFTLQSPPVKTKRVWVGIYSEMTGTVVMIFSKKPNKDKILGDYNVLDPSYVASVWIGEWEHWFGTVQPFVDAGLIEYQGDSIGWVVAGEDNDCHKVIPIDLTMTWNEHDEPIGLNMYADN